MEILIKILFWPFMIASIVSSFVALGLKKPIFLVVSCLLIIPSLLYLAATPRFALWGLIFPLFYLGSALSLRKNVWWLSALLIVPNIILIGWLGYVVINQ